MKPFAKKSLGQNFLVDNNYIEKIISELSLTEDDAVIEIGPGRGALTERLVESGAKVTAIEVDKDLIPVLQEQFSGSDNFRLVNEDALQADFGQILDSSFGKNSSQLIVHSTKLVANLPYYISTAILQRLIEQRACFSELVLMLQREVVDRIMAEPGNSERGFLTVLVEAHMETEHLFDVPPNAFRPAPKVWSAVMRLTPKKDAGITGEKLFREVIAAGFAYKRKTILNNFKNAPPKLKERFSDARKLLEDNEIDPQRRAETLAITEWKRLNDALISDGK